MGLANAQVVLPQSMKYPIENALKVNRDIQNKSLQLDQSTIEQDLITNKKSMNIKGTATYGVFGNQLKVDLPVSNMPPLPNPEFNMMLAPFLGNENTVSYGNLVFGGVTATKLLYSGGQIDYAVAALNYKRTGDSLMIETDRNALVADIIQTFDQLKFISASEELIADSQKRLAKEEERVNKAIENGLAVPFDRDKIKLARIELEVKTTQLNETRNLLYHKLSYLNGLPVNVIESIDYELQPILLNEDLDVNERAEFKALEQYKNANLSLLEKEKGSFKPQVLAFGNLSVGTAFGGKVKSDFPNYPAGAPKPEAKINHFAVLPQAMVGVGLKWNLYDGREKKDKIILTDLKNRELNNKIADSQDKLNLLLQQKKVAYSTQLKQIDLADQRLKVAENNLQQAEKQYNQGLITISQRLEAENDYVKARQQKVLELINQRKAAVEALEVSGTILDQIQYQK